MCDTACDYLKKRNIIVQSMCGVSYSGIPFAVLIAHKLEVPLFIRSKEISLSPDVVQGIEVTIIEEVIAKGNSTLQVIKVRFAFCV